MNGSQVGSIWYEVESDTSKLVNSAKEADGSLDRLSKKMGKTDGSAAKLETKMDKVSEAAGRMTRSVNSQSSAWSGLTKVVATYLSLRTLQAAVALSDQYMEMSSRIKNATSSSAEYEQVQQRLLETANGTYRSLNEAQEVYLSTADVLRSLGYTTSDVLDITDSMSYAFVRDAASKDRARAAMDAYSKSLQKGRIDADAWTSLLAATPSIVNGIASATGETTARVRQLGVTGKLSLEALNEGLRRSRDENKHLSDEMSTTVGDAFVNLSNSMQVFIGKVNESSGASDVLVGNIKLLAEALQDPEVIQAAQTLAAGVVGALTSIITTSKEVVGVVRWAAEGLAAALHGPVADDIVRLEQRLENLRKARARSFLGRIGNGYGDDELDAEIHRLEKLVALHHEASARQPAPAAPPPLPEEALDPRSSRRVSAEAVDAETAARRQLNEQRREELRLQRDLATARAGDAEYLDQLEAQMQQAALSGEELAVAQAKARLSPIADEATVRAVENYARSLYRAADGGRLLNDLHEQLASRQRQFARELESFGQGSNVRELNEEIAQVEDSYRSLINQRRASSQGLTDTELGQIRDAQAAELQMVRDHHQAKLDIQTDWTLGALDSLRNYAAESANIYDQIGDAVTGAFRGMENALVNFVQTGKLSVKDLANSIIADLARIAIRQSIVGPLANAFASAFGGMGASFSAPAVQASGGMNYGFDGFTFANPSGRANGGDVSAGKMYRINERGAPEILNTNGRQYLMMGQERGRVTPLDGRGAGAAGPTHVAININNQSGGSVSAESTSARMTPSGLVVDLLVRDVSENGPVSRSFAGAFGLRRTPGVGY